MPDGASQGCCKRWQPNAPKRALPIAQGSITADELCTAGCVGTGDGGVPGRLIYLDTDVVVRADVSELLDLDLQGHARKP